MEPLRFAINRRQSRGFLAVILGSVVLVDAILIYVPLAKPRTPHSPSNMTWILFTIGLTVLLLAITLPIYAMYARGWTELSPSGIRTRRLGRTRHVPWDQVQDIKVRSKNGAREVIVFTTQGRVLLSAPTSNAVISNRRLPEELEQIRDYWQQMKGQLAGSS